MEIAREAADGEVLLPAAMELVDGTAGRLQPRGVVVNGLMPPLRPYTIVNVCSPGFPNC